MYIYIYMCEEALGEAFAPFGELESVRIALNYIYMYMYKHTYILYIYISASIYIYI